MTYVDIEHRVTVGKLRELLDQLRDDDVLKPNAVGNLKIERAGEYAGFISLLHCEPEVVLVWDSEAE